MSIMGLDRHLTTVRLTASVAGNMIRGSLNLLAGVLVARSLGPRGYGDLTFLLVSFTAINQLLDLGTSTAFYTFVAQRKRSSRFYQYYIAWIGIQFVAALLLITVMPGPWERRIWVGHDRGIVLLAFAASFSMNQIWTFAAAMGESVRETVIVQARNVGLAAGYVLGIAALVVSRSLSIQTALLLNIAVYAIFSLSFAAYIRARILARPADTERFADVWRMFARYTAPLVMSVWVSFVYTFSDTWMLQQFGGSTQQGFYAVGSRLVSVSLLVAASMIPVFWKEIAEASETANARRVRNLYHWTSQCLYFATAMVSCFAVPYAREIVIGLMGYRFEAGSMALAVMLLYPVYQSLSQVNGAFLYATGQTRLYRNILIGTTLLSVMTTYFLLAPPHGPVGGLGLGAAGLAIKMVLLTIFSANLQSFFIRRAYGLRLTYWSQAATLALLLSLAFLAKIMIATLFSLTGFTASVWVQLPLGLIVYVAGVLAAIRLLLGIVGLTKTDLTLLSGRLRSAFLH